MGSTAPVHSPSERRFFEPLASLNPVDYERVEYAYKISKYGHGDQLRDDGSLFFDHPKRAAWIYISELGGRDPRVIIVTLLHDIREDTVLLSPYRAILNFGEEIEADVGSLTKLVGEGPQEQIARVIAQGVYAICPKSLDRLDNVRTLAGCTPEKRVRQIEETEKYHLPLLIPALASHGGVWAKYARKLDKKMKDALNAAKLL